MPPGTPYNSFIVPYPIRVDEFSVPRDDSLTVAALHLLTHTHSDHVKGLNAKSFSSVVICSKDAKEMLLRHETYLARCLRENELVIERARTYSHLKTTSDISDITAHNEPHAYDLLRALPLEAPTEIEISNNEWVTVTLLDANHCPGSVMFLIEGSKGAILHTGDFRAERCFINSINENPFLKPYLVSTGSAGVSTSRRRMWSKTLEAIYLDTASMLRMCTVPSKSEATKGLIELMLNYPSHTRFYINSWTWGYEDILKAIYLTFRSKIHVDRYKYEVYTSLSDPILRELVTRDPKITRFHACERFDRCAVVRSDDPSVVYINPVSMGCDNWNLYNAKMRMSVKREELPTHLLVPLHRHSPLPELQDFVRLFRPKRLVPNFLMPGLQGIDWACMPNMFGPCMAEGGLDRIREEMAAAVTLDAISEFNSEILIEDAEVSNLEGGEAKAELDTLVGVWTSAPGVESGQSSTGSLLHRMQKYLPKGMSVLIERTLRNARMKKLPQVYEENDKDDTDTSDDEDGAWRTAEMLFGGHLNLPQSNNSSFSSPVSAKSSASLCDQQQKSTLQDSGRQVLNEDFQAMKVPITPPSSNRSVHQVPVRIGEDQNASKQPSKLDLTQGTMHDTMFGSLVQLSCRQKDHCLQRVKAIAPKSPLGNSSQTNLQDGSSIIPTALALASVGLLSKDQITRKAQSADMVSITAASITVHQERVDGISTSDVSSISQVDSNNAHASCSFRKRPLSPESTQITIQVKRAANSGRFNLAEKLSFARPDLATQEMKRNLKADGDSQKHTSSNMTCAMLTGPDEDEFDEESEYDDDGRWLTSSADSAGAVMNNNIEGKCSEDADGEPPMDWARSRRLQEAILDDLRNGRRPQLPALKFVLDGLFGRDG